MKDKFVVLGTGYDKIEDGKPHGAPELIRVEKTKFDREVGDKMRIDDKVWLVLYVTDDQVDAKEMMNSMVKLFVQKGYWKNVKNSKKKY